MKNTANSLQFRAMTGLYALAIALFVAVILPASRTIAAPVDPGGSGAQMTDVQDGTETWVSTYGVPAIGTLLLIGIGVILLIRWGKRGASVVS